MQKLPDTLKRLHDVIDLKDLCFDELCIVRNGYLSVRKNQIVVLLSLPAYKASLNNEAKRAVAILVKQQLKLSLPLTFEGLMEPLDSAIAPENSLLGQLSRMSIHSSRLRWNAGFVEVLGDKEMRVFLGQESVQTEINLAIRKLSDVNVQIEYTYR